MSPCPITSMDRQTYSRLLCFTLPPLGMARNGLTLDAAAQELGLSRRMLAYYRSGEKPLPRTVALACKWWEAERHALAA